MRVINAGKGNIQLQRVKDCSVKWDSQGRPPGEVTFNLRLQEMRRQTCRYQMEERWGREDSRCKGPEAAVNLCLRDSKEASVAGMV